jgi:hypothetical protein
MAQFLENLSMNAVLKTLPQRSKKLAIVQSNYIPWKGYFDMIASVDEFVLYDDMQFTRRDWRNRNLIKTPQGLLWLTVPVRVKGKFFQSIRDTEIEGQDWAEKHWKTFKQNYAKAAYFREIQDLLAPCYFEPAATHLSQLNRSLIKTICEYLGITTQISDSSDYVLSGDKSEKLLCIAQAAHACTYVSGPSAMDYLDTKIFEAQDIAVEWFSYAAYPVYPQAYGEFTHQVSILDLLFHCGPQSPRYMRSGHA